MIYTITFNPAIDLVMQMDTITLGELNRSKSEHYIIGGKGINMSVVLNRLNWKNTAITFLGGFSGEYIKSELEKDGITVYNIPVENVTRINVKLKGEVETECNANGAFISPENFNRLYDFLDIRLRQGDTLFLAGNKAPGMTEHHYVLIAKLCRDKEVNLVLDTTKELLQQCLAYKPFIIKPNHHELGELFGVSITTIHDCITYAQKLQEQGAKNVLVSRGGEGSFLLTENGDKYIANVPKGQVINSVGAGDSMLAGFIAEYLHSHCYKKALQQGAATGSATAFSMGITQKELIETLLPQIKVTTV
ncbi:MULTISPECIES: 1-phosphofructokinase [unclassified Granulicatella]|uniref:1-phosphofructokinase n=1 Tax=unclassified Granulicatella TaxID=2630493 RepID=UPI001073823A|nr:MULTISPECIES: 1-phosphofructokinase [unclassified Granulicatella]MBF0779669.1 1-phosphofructokinase [Granulicatella sp. 19428wC4_WM01]TFU96324.1 1-phosphofructokinase [Granulicatella sp. WM01]